MYKNSWILYNIHIYAMKVNKNNEKIHYSCLLFLTGTTETKVRMKSVING